MNYCRTAYIQHCRNFTPPPPEVLKAGSYHNTYVGEPWGLIVIIPRMLEPPPNNSYSDKYLNCNYKHAAYMNETGKNPSCDWDYHTLAVKRLPTESPTSDVYISGTPEFGSLHHKLFHIGTIPGEWDCSLGCRLFREVVGASKSPPGVLYYHEAVDKIAETLIPKIIVGSYDVNMNLINPSL